MNHFRTHDLSSRKDAERSPAAILLDAARARVALGEALQGIVRLLDLLRETDSAEEIYWALCDEHERALSLTELPPDRRSVLELRQAQKTELRALFVAYHEAERRWQVACRELNDRIHRRDG
jgi:hypothetical protein